MLPIWPDNLFPHKTQQLVTAVMVQSLLQSCQPSCFHREAFIVIWCLWLKFSHFSICTIDTVTFLSTSSYSHRYFPFSALTLLVNNW